MKTTYFNITEKLARWPPFFSSPNEIVAIKFTCTQNIETLHRGNLKKILITIKKTLKTRDFKLSTILESRTKTFNKLVQWTVLYPTAIVWFILWREKCFTVITVSGRFSGHVRVRRVKTVSSHLKVARNSFLEGGLGRWLRVLARAHQAHAGANLAILYPRKFCKIHISIKNISESWRWKFVKFGTVVKNGQKFMF